jgi:hypothetical protein
LGVSRDDFKEPGGNEHLLNLEFLYELKQVLSKTDIEEADVRRLMRHKAKLARYNETYNVMVEVFGIKVRKLISAQLSEMDAEDEEIIFTPMESAFFFLETNQLRYRLNKFVIDLVLLLNRDFAQASALYSRYAHAVSAALSMAILAMANGASPLPEYVTLFANLTRDEILHILSLTFAKFGTESVIAMVTFLTRHGLVDRVDVTRAQQGVIPSPTGRDYVCLAPFLGHSDMTLAIYVRQQYY